MSGGVSCWQDGKGNFVSFLIFSVMFGIMCTFMKMSKNTAQKCIRPYKLRVQQQFGRWIASNVLRPICFHAPLPQTLCQHSCFSIHCGNVFGEPAL